MVDADSRQFRLARLAAIKREIAAGTYETPAKLSDALENLLDNLESGAKGKGGDTNPPAESTL